MRILKSIGREFCRSHHDGPYYSIEMLGFIALCVSVFKLYITVN